MTNGWNNTLPTVLEIMSKLLIEKDEIQKTEWKNNLVEILPKLVIERDEIKDEKQLAAFDKVMNSLLFFLQNFP